MARHYFTATRGHILFYLCLIIALLIIAMILFHYDTKYHGSEIMDKHSEVSGQRDVLITNQTLIPQNVIFEDGRDELIPPSGHIYTRLHLGATIYAHSKNYMQNTARLNNPVVRELHITPDGIKSEINVSKQVFLQNKSNDPVIFVHRSSKGGRRWPTQVVYPNSEIILPIIPTHSKWEVVKMGKENRPLDVITIGGKIGSLMYDGYQLSTSKKTRFEV